MYLKFIEKTLLFIEMNKKKLFKKTEMHIFKKEVCTLTGDKKRKLIHAKNEFFKI